MVAMFAIPVLMLDLLHSELVDTEMTSSNAQPRQIVFIFKKFGGFLGELLCFLPVLASNNLVSVEFLVVLAIYMPYFDF